MNSLFLDLFAYRQRENRDPVEDWLTECLAATMRALPEVKLAQLLSWLSDPANEALILSHVKSGKVAIKTQYVTANAGRPDMVVTIGGIPWIVFENKVGHHLSERLSEEGGESHQLRGYADWLKEACDGCELRPGIVFVTHLTPPPVDFKDDYPVDYYHGFSRRRLSWGEFTRKLLQLSGDLDENHHALNLADALQAYLEDNNMSSDFPDAVALASAQLYVSQAASVEYLVDRMWQEAASIASCGKNASYRVVADPGYGTVNAQRYAVSAPNSPSGWSYIETGVWFPELDSWYSKEDIGRDLVGPHVYVGFFNGDDDYFTMTSDIPEGFLRPASDFLAIESLSTFSADPEMRGGEIVSWVANKARALRAFLLERKIVK